MPNSAIYELAVNNDDPQDMKFFLKYAFQTLRIKMKYFYKSQPPRTFQRLLMIGLLMITAGGCQTPLNTNQDHEAKAISRSLNAVATSAEKRGDLTTSLVYYRQSYRSDPNNIDNLLDYASLLRRTGANTESLNILKTALSNGKNKGDILAEMGKTQLSMNNLHDAVISLETAIFQGSNSWATHLALGVSYDRRGEHLKAQRAYKLGLAGSPNNLMVLNNLALSYALEGSIEKGIEVLEKIARAPTATIQMRQNLALLHGLNGEIALAKKVSKIESGRSIISQDLSYNSTLTDNDHTLQKKSDLQTYPSYLKDNSKQASTLKTSHIELGFSPTAEEAINGWELLQRKYQTILQGLNVEIVKRRIQDGANKFLIWAGPFINQGKGEAICNQLREEDEHCIVVSP